MELSTWLNVALIFVLFATIELVYRILKKEPFWPNLKRWLTNLFDTLSGGG